MIAGSNISEHCIIHQGSIVLVTGAASGIGRALALGCAARGAHVLLADRNADGLAHSAGLIADAGGSATAMACDLADPAEPVRLVEEAYASHGRLDLICSNAGLSRNKRLIKENRDASVEALFAVNFWAGLTLAQAYAAQLGQRGAAGRILFTASENALSVPSAVRGAGLGLYAASKHALLIMAEWLRDENAGRGLDVHVLLPGAVYTPMIAGALPDPQAAPAALNLISAEDCAAIALRGLDLGLFYIPTQAHLADDMRARQLGVEAALRRLGIG